MVGCFLWWGKFPLALIQSGETKEIKYHRAWAPPFLFQSSLVGSDDDQAEFLGDDDEYQQGERIRGTDYTIQRSNAVAKKKNVTDDVDIDTSSMDDDSDLSTEQDSSYEYLYKSRPKIVWLMSYPNSGTSYTMTMVARASNRAIATNYGREVTVPPIPNTPLYPGYEWSYQGPYYNPDPRRPLPKEYILVKTHCGGTYLL